MKPIQFSQSIADVLQKKEEPRKQYKRIVLPNAKPVQLTNEQLQERLKKINR